MEPPRRLRSGLRLRLVPVVALALVASACATLSFEAGEVEDPIPPVFSVEAVADLPPRTGGEAFIGTEARFEDDPNTLALGFAGDTSFTHGLWSRDPFGDIFALTRAPDLMLVNLETVIAERGLGVAADKAFTFKSPPESVDILQEAGIDGVALANNHTLDFGRSAMDRTVELLDGQGLGHAGAGSNEAEAYAPMTFIRGGRSVAVLSYSRVLEGNWAATEVRSGLASVYAPGVERSVEAVRDAAALADLVIVMVHWGIELEACPLPYQRDLARQWVEAGADLVIGSHPHVLQGVERIKNSWVVYSTGNFVFPSARQESASAAMFFFEVEDDSMSLGTVPVQIVGGRPAPAVDATRQRVLDLLSARSFGYVFTPDGKARLSPGSGRCG